MSAMLRSFVLLAALVMAASAYKVIVPNCASCTSSYYCYPCVSTNNAICTNDWTYSTTCCSASSLGIVKYCTGSNCCALVNRILLYIGIAAGIVTVLIVAAIVFWCIRTRRNRVEYGGFTQQPAEVVEVHHYQQQTYGAPQQTYGSPAQVGYQAAPAYAQY